MPRAKLHLAYPGGMITDNSNTAAENAGILTGRTIITEYNTGQGNPLYLYSLMLDSTSDLTTFTDAYTKAFALGCSLYLTIHDIKEAPSESWQVSTSVFQSIVDYCKDNYIKAQTITQYYAALLK